MRPKLQKAITDWKNQAIHEAREVTIKKLKGGEYIIVISAAIDLDLEGQVETVYQYKFLLTMAQSGDTNRNPIGDVYNFEKASNLVINKFLDRCSKVIELFIGDNTSEFESV